MRIVILFLQTVVGTKRYTAQAGIFGRDRGHLGQIFKAVQIGGDICVKGAPFIKRKDIFQIGCCTITDNFKAVFGSLYLIFPEKGLKNKGTNGYRKYGDGTGHGSRIQHDFSANSFWKYRLQHINNPPSDMYYP